MTLNLWWGDRAGKFFPGKNLLPFSYLGEILLAVNISELMKEKG